MQKRNLYSFLIAKGKSREQLTYQDILSVKVSNQEGEKQYIAVPPEVQENNLLSYLQKFTEHNTA